MGRTPLRKPRASTSKRNTRREPEYESDDSLPDPNGNMSFASQGRDSSEDDEEVFNLDAEDDDSESDDSEDSEDSEDEGDSDGSDESNELDELVDKLPAHLRQKVVMQKGEGEDSDSDEESDEENGDETSGWGKKKNFWSADTADLEIGQDAQDAEDEEEAAMVSAAVPRTQSIILFCSV